MKSKSISYWLLVSLAFVITQPGAITFANWDPPYGFYRDLTEWMSCAGAFLILVTVYGIIEWKKGKLGLIHPLGAGLLGVATILLGYWAEGFIRGEMGYGSSNILVFIIGGFLGLILALVLLPLAIPYALTGELYYPYDRPLIMAWLFSLAVSVALLVIYIKTKREKFMERGNQAP